MYLWKCWRDTRPFFVVFLIIAAAVMPVAAVVCLSTGLKEFGEGAFQTTFATNKYPPAEPEVLRLLAPQRGLIATGQSQNHNLHAAQ